jgi:hypothetical protein
MDARSKSARSRATRDEGKRQRGDVTEFYERGARHAARKASCPSTLPRWFNDQLSNNTEEHYE